MSKTEHDPIRVVVIDGAPTARDMYDQLTPVVRKPGLNDPN